jgi:phosphate transport system substrate-binding protein
MGGRAIWKPIRSNSWSVISSPLKTMPKEKIALEPLIVLPTVSSACSVGQDEPRRSFKVNAVIGRTRRVLFIAAFTLASCSSRVLPAATPIGEGSLLRVYATTSATPLIYDLTRAYARENPQVVFEIETANFQTLVSRLLNGDMPYFLTSHLPAENAAGGGLWAAPLAQDGIAVITHPDNPVSDLSRGQIRNIFTGRMPNWMDVGGADAAITVFSREDGSGTRAEFESLVLGDGIPSFSAQILPNSAAMVESVSRTPNSIGYVSTSYLNPTLYGAADTFVRPLAIDGVAPTLTNIANNTYPLRSLLYIVGLREPDGSQPGDLDYRAFIGWVQSPQGQEVVSQRYAPLTP